MFPSFEEPLILSVTLNTHCGLHCSFCSDYNIYEEMSDVIFNKVTDFIKTSTNLTTVTISGGEPLLDERLNRLILICNKNKIQVSVDTNCNMTLGEQSNTILNCGQIRLKLLSIVCDKHNRLVGVRGHYQKICQFMGWLNNNFKHSKVLLFPLLNSNLDEIELAAEFAIDHGFYCNFFAYPRGFNKLASLNKNEYSYVIKKIGEVFESYPNKIFLDVPLAGLNNRSLKNICPAIFISTHIDVDGHLRPCKYASMTIGSLKEYSLYELWDMQKIEVKWQNLHCTNCNQYPNCGGGCFANKTDCNIDYYCPVIR